MRKHDVHSKYAVIRHRWAVLPRFFRQTAYVILVAAAFIAGALFMRATNIRQGVPAVHVPLKPLTHHAATDRSNSESTAPQANPATPPSVSAQSAPKTASSGSTACGVLPITAARQALGAGAQPDPSNAANVASADMSASTCRYASDSSNTVELMAHVALSPTGASENDVQFGSGIPSGTTQVSGYGQSAYWDPAAGQLDILVNNNWYAISRKSNGADTLDAATSIASLIAPEMK